MTGECCFFKVLLLRNIKFKIVFFVLMLRMVLNDYLPRTCFEAVGPPREVVVQPRHQREAVVQEGPTNNPNFRIQGWTFHVRGIDMRMSMHVNDPPSVKRAVTSELETIVQGALQQCHRDGAQMEDIVHFYLECAGLDYSFCFNPSGPNAVTLGESCVIVFFFSLYFFFYFSTSLNKQYLFHC